MTKPLLSFTLVIALFAMIFFALGQGNPQNILQIGPFALVATGAAFGIALTTARDEPDVTRLVLGFALGLTLVGVLFFSFAASPVFASYATPFAVVAGGIAIAVGIANRRSPSVNGQFGLGVVLVLMLLGMMFFALMAMPKYRLQSAPYALVAAAAALGLGLGCAPVRLRAVMRG